LNFVNTPKINNFTLSTYEKENDFGIGVFDAHARVFDPVTPRFWSIDSLSELSRRFSPFVFSNNNPLRFIDPDGMISRGFFDDLWSNSDDGANTTWTNNGDGSFLGDNGRLVNDDKGKEKDKGDKEGTRLIGTTSTGNSGTAIASATLAWIGADIIAPEPTDLALPKWAAYGVAGATAGAYLYSADIVGKLKNAFDPKGFKYVTYTKTSKDGFVYVGRSSGYESPEQIVRNRDSGHHIKGYGKAVLSTFAPATIDGGFGKRLLDPAYWSIRGSEQIQIEFYRNLGISGNDRNGIGAGNKFLKQFMEYGRKLLE
jgi:RHS repeat-associated protein